MFLLEISVAFWMNGWMEGWMGCDIEYRIQGAMDVCMPFYRYLVIIHIWLQVYTYFPFPYTSLTEKGHLTQGNPSPDTKRRH